MKIDYKGFNIQNDGFEFYTWIPKHDGRSFKIGRKNLDDLKEAIDNSIEHEPEILNWVKQ